MSRNNRSEYDANRALSAHGCYPDFRRSEYERYARECLRERGAKMRAVRRQRWYAWVAVALAILALGLIGKMDEEAARQDLAHYCSMVQQRAWPDYRHIAATDCRGVDSRR
jgi:hypothetical protein